MAEEFFRFFDELIDRGYYMHLDIGYNKVADYCIKVWRKGVGPNNEDIELAWAQEIDMELAFAKAYVQLKKYLLEHEGGY